MMIEGSSQAWLRAFDCGTTDMGKVILVEQ